MLERLSRLAVARWRIVLALTALFCIYGWRCFDGLPIEAFPDVTDPRVEVVGTYPGQAAEEVERRVTVELERVLAGTPKLLDLRSVSVFGLSLVTLTFEEGTTDFELRTSVAERLRDAVLPEGAAAQMGPQSTPVGQIYRYTLRGPLGLKDLRSIQDFVVERRLRAVPGVADVVTFGGFERNYQIRVDPIRLTAAGISVDDVHAAIARANENAGGGYSGIGSQEFVVRGMGVIRDPHELGDIVLDTRGSVPIHIRDIADVIEGSTPRRGAVGRGHADDVIEGIILLRRKAHPSLVLEAVHERIEDLNRNVLPPGVTIDTFYDRTTLMHSTLATVRRNLLEGVSLVLLVVWVFLGSLRAVVAVAVVVPISMLSAFAGLTWLGLPANLISLGAIDFGILVDGAIVVLEATLHLFHERSHGGRLSATETAGVIAEAAASVVRPVVFAMAIIIVALVPIFFLERVEGRIFAPMAYTYAFALGGALVSAMLVVPALERLLFRGRFRTAEPAWLLAVRWIYLKLLAGCDTIRWAVLPAAAAACLGLGWYASGIGTEFLPELNEGGFYVTSIFPSTISLDETRRQVAIMREAILRTPEVSDVMSHVGRPENATQAEGPNNAEFFIALKPEGEWVRGRTRQGIEAELRRSLAVIPGAQHNFSQPITDRVFETISGIIGQVVLKIRGTDLERMTQLAEEAKARLAAVPGGNLRDLERRVPEPGTSHGPARRHGADGPVRDRRGAVREFRPLATHAHHPDAPAGRRAGRRFGTAAHAREFLRVERGGLHRVGGPSRAVGRDRMHAVPAGAGRHPRPTAGAAHRRARGLPAGDAHHDAGITRTRACGARAWHGQRDTAAVRDRDCLRPDRLVARGHDRGADPVFPGREPTGRHRRTRPCQATGWSGWNGVSHEKGVA